MGFKILKNWTNILQVLGDEGFKVQVGRVVYKDWGIKRGWEEVLSIERGFQQKDFGEIISGKKDRPWRTSRNKYLIIWMSVTYKGDQNRYLQLDNEIIN